MLNEEIAISALARETGIAEGTLYRWREATKPNGEAVSVIKQLGSMLPSGTDFLWLVRKCRIHSLKAHVNNCLYALQKMGPERIVELRSDSVIRGLREGWLIPDLLLVFALISFMPGYRCLGGFFQTSYVPVLRHTFLAMLDPSNPDEAQLIEDSEQRFDHHGWGTHVLELDAVFPLLAEVGHLGAMDRLIERFALPSLRATTHGLRQFRCRERWLPVLQDVLRRPA